MITDFFKSTSASASVEDYPYFQLRRGFTPGQFQAVFEEISPHFAANYSRQSCVCLTDPAKPFGVYDLPTLAWTPVLGDVRRRLEDLDVADAAIIDYGLVHYYNKKAFINWHSDREAMHSPIYSVSFGGTRRFCMRNRATREVFDFDLHDGDLFIMKTGCQEKFEHCIKALKEFDLPRISVTFRCLEGTTPTPTATP